MLIVPTVQKPSDLEVDLRGHKGQFQLFIQRTTRETTRLFRLKYLQWNIVVSFAFVLFPGFVIFPFILPFFFLIYVFCS